MSAEATSPSEPTTGSSGGWSPRRRWIAIAIAVNVVVIIVAIVVITSTSAAVTASEPPPPTEAELFADMRATPLDVGDALMSFADQAEVLNGEDGVVRSQVAGIMVSKAGHGGSHVCMGLVAPTLPEGAAWSTRTVWPNSDVSGEAVMTSGVQVFADSTAAQESFGLLTKIADECSGSLEIDQQQTTGGEALQVTETDADGDSVWVEHTRVGNVVFLTKVACVNCADSAVNAAATGALEAARDRVAGFAGIQLEELRAAHAATEAEG